MPAAGHVNAREKEEKVETILALLIQAQTIPWVGWALAWALLFRTSSAQLWGNIYKFEIGMSTSHI